MPRKGKQKEAVPLNSFHVRGDAWFYVTRAHLEVIRGKDHPSGVVRIPWGRIMRQAAKCGTWDAKQGLWLPRSRVGGGAHE